MFEAGAGLPEDLELMGPGPELAVVLASVDRSGLDPEQLLRLARARDRLVAHCEELIDRLPAVFAALGAGEIDVPKARVLVDAVACLDDQVATAIVSQVLATASRHTIGELRARLRRLVLTADPTLATRRARRDVADRRACWAGALRPACATSRILTPIPWSWRWAVLRAGPRRSV
jgi:hypothetical protein